MALPGAFLEELRARTSLHAIIGRRARLERAGRQWKTCCPFHGERTPSFHIWEDHYHCFGCGVHGDAITFVMQTENASFMEAVERLAGEAGLEVPRLSPALAEAEQRRHTLSGVLEMAVQSFQRRLFLPEGRTALEYLRGRGLSEETIRRFGLGWSGAGRGTLAADLSREGITPSLLIEAGLLRADDETGRTYDLFHDRIMFPIRNRRGAVISFGGRTLGDSQPKYLNGPETALFSKRRSLYGIDLARAARDAAEIVVVEGYMDVIAVHQAGFQGAVAPLGTALTEEQLAELWRLSPAPVLCFDGDAAGARAAARAAELALPLLAPDRTLKIASLPQGEDPDTLIRRASAVGFRTVLSAARPLVEAVFDLLRESVGDQTVEHRAQLHRRLEEAARRIPDRALAREYRSALLDRFFASRRRVKDRPRVMPRPLPSDQATADERARILTAILLRHPVVLRHVEHAYTGLRLPPVCHRIRTALLQWADSVDVLDSPGLINHLTASGLAAEAEQVTAAVPGPLPRCALVEALPGDAEAGWWHIFGLMNRARLEDEVAAAGRELSDRADEDAQRRLIALCAARDALARGEPVDFD
jgi:DNA primase